MIAICNVKRVGAESRFTLNVYHKPAYIEKIRILSIAIRSIFFNYIQDKNIK